MRDRRRLLIKGLILQFSNPGAPFFFLAILPQFILPGQAYLPQFLLFILSFCGLLILVYTGYTVFARRIRLFLGKGTGVTWLNRVGGAVFVGFALALLHSGRRT